MLNVYPDMTAVKKMTATIIATNFFRNMLASIDISGMAIPAESPAHILTVHPGTLLRR